MTDWPQMRLLQIRGRTQHRGRSRGAVLLGAASNITGLSAKYNYTAKYYYTHSNEGEVV